MDTCASKPAPGDRLGSHEVLESLHTPPAGGLFRVRDVRSDTRGILRWIDSGTRGVEEGFLRDAEILAGLRHPNLLSTCSGGSTDRGFYLVFEDSQGSPFSSTDLVTGQTTSALVETFSAILRGLSFLHDRELALGGFSPEEVLIEADGSPRLLPRLREGFTEESIGKDLQSFGELLQWALGRMSDPVPPRLEAFARECVDPTSDPAPLETDTLVRQLVATLGRHRKFRGPETARIDVTRARRRRKVRKSLVGTMALVVVIPVFFILYQMTLRYFLPIRETAEELLAKEGATDRDPGEGLDVSEAILRSRGIEEEVGPEAALAFLDEEVGGNSSSSSRLETRRSLLRWRIEKNILEDLLLEGRMPEALERFEEHPPSMMAGQCQQEREPLLALCRGGLALEDGDVETFEGRLRQFLRGGGALDLLFAVLLSMERNQPEDLPSILKRLGPAMIGDLSRALLVVSRGSEDTPVVLDWLSLLAERSDPRWMSLLVRLVSRRSEPIRLAAVTALADCAIKDECCDLPAILRMLSPDDRLETGEYFTRAGRTFYDRGLARYATGEYQQALACADRAVFLLPRDPYPLLLRADIHHETGRIPDSLIDLMKAQDLERASRDVKWRLGRSYRELGRFEEARNLLDGLAGAVPSSGRIALERGLLLYYLRHFTEANQELERAFRLLDRERTALSVCRSWQTMIMIHFEEIETALRLARESILLDESHPVPHAVLALALLASGEGGEATKRVNISIALNPTWIALYTRGRIALETDHFGNAFTDLSAALDRAPCDRGEICFYAARAQTGLGDPRAALELFERAREFYPGLPGLHGEIEAAKGQVGKD